MKGWKRRGEWLEWTAPAELSSVREADPAWLERLGEKWLRRWEASGSASVKGRRLLLRMFPEESGIVAGAWLPLEVLYEDDFCLVADKPAGMKVHPTQEGEEGTLLHAAAWHLEASGQRVRARPVHRLDEDTTGPVLIAKCEWAQVKLDEEMREKRITREYCALVQGRVERARGTLDAPIGRDRHHATRRRVSPTGERAVTHYEVAERLQDATLVRLRLETGRTHQIRVHLAHLGHPLIGDRLYGGPADGEFRRQALHGERLTFAHPLTGENVEADSPWPEDFRSLYERLLFSKK
ncbi:MULTISPECIES: RluA family pseudouridine synthase [Paenibacillus]|uniref:RluA family pseudouridine synthase n=1 Tax=Paenibacillus TaxID=44249 RepID=UPI0022B916A4|nr:RluA family pseudouridine synthase [Paenibacillus caseinilyticus]MCZ8519100.1 RluA family pseudouridine synthase [Paenibacillus caseinilyticus]